MRCHQCGQENAPGAALCARCSAVLDLPTSPWGERVEGDAAPPRPSAPPRDPRRLPATPAPGAAARRRVAPVPSSPPGPASKPPDPRRKLIATADLPAFPGPPPRIDPLATAIEPAGQRRDGTSPWGGAPAQPRPEAPRRPDTRRDSETDQVPIDSLLEKVRGKEPPRAPRAQPWDEVIAKAPPATLERWGTTPEAEADTALALPALKREPPPERPAPRPPARSGTATETSLPKWSELPGGDTVRQPPLPSPPSPPSRLSE